MENASVGCVRKPDKNQKIFLKSPADDAKPKRMNPYVNKPIFRRKLIEKYSTARYNINTKRVLIKKSPTSQNQCNENVAKIPQESDDSSQIENHLKPTSNLRSSAALSKDDFNSTMPTTRKLVYEEGLAKKLKSSISLKDDVSLKTATFDEASSCESSSSLPIQSVCNVSPIKKHGSEYSRKRKSNSTTSSSGSKATWKIAPKTVYNNLWDLYQSTVEIKTEEPEPKKETKKRKNVWAKKRTRRKPLSFQKKLADRTHFDPYVECLQEAETQSRNVSPGQSNDKLGIVMYLGVSRPLFPLIYRNLRVLNDFNDEKITDFWSEFALSTLITKPEDKKCKPILVPVKDSELASLVSECIEEVVSTKVLNVSNASSASDDQTIKDENNLAVRIKQEENDAPVPQKKRRYKPRSLNSIFKSYALRRNISKKVEENELEKPRNNRKKIEENKQEKPLKIESITCAATSSPKKRISIPDEKAILKKFGYKECIVAIPKLSDTLIKYLSAGNYSNQSAERRDPTERELIEETDDFGLIQCTRTDGIIIDYVSRNRSLVYFYKLKKMLDFQKTNNKYFVSCDYILIDNAVIEEDVDVMSIQGNDECDKPGATACGPRNSKNPNDLFKSSKISEWKDKSSSINWVKNHDLKAVSDVKWLLISLDKHIASLSHTSGCVLRYRLLFEIIYRAELSKKVICCEIAKVSGTASDKLTFGVYAFPGLCDKVLVGPYLNHEEHQLSSFIRTSNGSSERALIKTLEEKENFPQSDESLPVKHINAKWWSGNNNDLTEQYLNFFFNPSIVKCTQSTDRFSLSKIIADHPCQNYHSYEITGRESNVVLFHDRSNAVAKTTVSSTKIPVQIDVDATSNHAKKVSPPTQPLKESRNLRKKPRRDYSQLITDDMAVHPKTKNSELHIIDVKSLRKRAVHNEMKAKLKRVSRYQDSPETHILNERLRRLEFRNRRNDLASVLEARPTGSNNQQPLISILNQAKEIITYLEVDNDKLDEEGKRLRLEQSVLMKKFLAKLRSLDIRSEAYKNGMTFVALWKQVKSEHRNKLINILGQNFDKQKTNKTAESARTATAKRPSATVERTPYNRAFQRHWASVKKAAAERQTSSRPLFGARGDEYKPRERDSHLIKDDDTAQRAMNRKKKRQKMRDVLRSRNHSHQNVTYESVECEISEQVVCVNGKSSDPLGSNHMLDGMGEVPIIISNIPGGVDPYAIDPLANDDEDDVDADASSLTGKYSISESKQPSHPLYYEHSYCNLGGESSSNSKKSSYTPISFLSNARIRPRVQVASTLANRYRPNRPILPHFKPLLLSTSTIRNPYRPNNPIINNYASSLQRPVPTIRGRPPKPIPGVVRMPRAAPVPAMPTFQIRINDSAEENLGIDILDNGRMFARLNIAKINNGGNANANNANKATTSSSSRRAGIAGTATSSKIMTIIQRFLQQMEKTSPTSDANDDERAKQAKRKYVVNSLKSFISKFENRRKNLEETGDSASRASNSDDASASNVVDNIELESGYSSKSEESCDRDYDTKAKESSVVRNRIVNDEAIENIVLDDDSQNEEEEEEIEAEDQVEEEVLREEELITEEEEEEIIGQEEFIEEEEEEEEIGADENTLQEMNDVDAAMRVDENDPFANSDDSTDATTFSSRRDDDEFSNLVLELNEDSLDSRNEKRIEISQLPSKVFYSTNQFAIIRPKNKFIPNIMKTPTKISVSQNSASDHLSRIQIKPSAGSLVKLSTSDSQPSTDKISQIPSSGNSESIIKRLWYSPVTKADETDLKILRRESTLSESVKTPNVLSEKMNEKDSTNSEEENSNDETGSSSEKNNSGANRIAIKSFANHEKFQEAFLSNVDKLLNPES